MHTIWCSILYFSSLKKVLVVTPKLISWPYGVGPADRQKIKPYFSMTYSANLTCSPIFCISAVLYCLFKNLLCYFLSPFTVSSVSVALLPTWLCDKFSFMLLKAAKTLLKVVYDDKNKGLFASTDISDLSHQTNLGRSVFWDLNHSISVKLTCDELQMLFG